MRQQVLAALQLVAKTRLRLWIGANINAEDIVEFGKDDFRYLPDISCLRRLAYTV